jgi:septation ring formation regulator EzrA
VIDQELIAVLDARFGALNAQLETRFSRLETDIRHANVQIESLRDETRQVGESVILLDEKLERFRVTTEQRFDEVDRRFELVDRGFELIDRRFEAIDGRFEAIDGRFEAIDGRFEEMKRLIRRS